MMKRKRDSTFTASEKRYLIELIEKHISIIECEKSDAISLKNKTEEWQKIDRLPAVFEINLKKRAKLELTSRNQHFIGTGGGPPIKEKGDPITDKVLELIRASVSDYINIFDLDGTHILATNINKTSEDTLQSENIE